jgi:peptidoglycan/LPS O-acetylase OafA/YrhL
MHRVDDGIGDRLFSPMEDPPPVRRKGALMPRKIADIQVLRACAILFVIVNHSTYRIMLPDLFRHGFTGVDLFFLISGFVITASSLRITEAFGTADFTRDFLIRRFFRIVPLAVGWLIVYWAMLWFVWGRDITQEVLQILSLTFNYRLTADAAAGHYWSLVLEEHFYIGFAFFFPVLMRLKLLAPVSIVGIIFVGEVLRPLAGDPAHMTHARIDSFLVGALLAYAPGYARTLAQSKAARVTMAVFVVPLLLTVWCLFAIPGMPAAFTLTMLASAALVFIGSANRNLIVQIPLLRPALEWIGERSYSLYLAHPLVIYFEILLCQRSVAWTSVPAPARALCLFGAILTAGAISYIIERRWEEVGREAVEFARKRSPKVDDAAALAQ